MSEMLLDAKTIVKHLADDAYWLKYPRKWAEEWVHQRMEFHRKHGRGLTLSTSHGIEFFQNVVDACEGRLKWKEEGIYGDNFRRLIKEGNA